MGHAIGQVYVAESFKRSLVGTTKAAQAVAIDKIKILSRPMPSNSSGGKLVFNTNMTQNKVTTTIKIDSRTVRSPAALTQVDGSFSTIRTSYGSQGRVFNQGDTG